MASVDKVEETLIEIEEVAEQILANKQQIVDLDKKRQQLREANRVLSKSRGDKKRWVCMSNMFIKMPEKYTKSILEKDFDKLDTEINSIRKTLKAQVSRLRDLEQQEDLKGFDLKPLSDKELKAVESIL
ncbi:p53 and DNA damage-regulated protein 1-like [Argonauta hians]